MKTYTVQVMPACRQCEEGLARGLWLARRIFEESLCISDPQVRARKRTYTIEAESPEEACAAGRIHFQLDDEKTGEAWQKTKRHNPSDSIPITFLAAWAVETRTMKEEGTLS